MQLAKDDMMAESSLLRNNVIWNVEFQAGNILTIKAQVKFWILNNFRPNPGVSVQGVESLWGDCMFIPADWGS